MATYPAAANVSLGEDLTASLRENKAFSASHDVVTRFLVMGNQSVSTKTAGETVAFLEDLRTHLAGESAFDQSRIDDLSPTILQLPGQLRHAKNEVEFLSIEQDIATNRGLAYTQQSVEARSAS